MEQELTGLAGRWAYLGGLLLCAALTCSCRGGEGGTKPMVATNNSESNAAPAAAESARLAKRIAPLRELALPDEWYSATGASLAARFAAAAKAMQAKDPQAPSGPQLMARFQNDGQPFVHKVWFNQPLFCPICPEATGDGSFAVVSVARGLNCRVTAGEFHAVTAHGGSFPPDKLSLLKRILDSP